MRDSSQIKVRSADKHCRSSLGLWASLLDVLSWCFLDRVFFWVLVGGIGIAEKLWAGEFMT